jgi:nucleoside-diphosphate-sugar epimerase
VYGVTYADGHVDFPSFPVDESVDTNPVDVYSLSKVCAECTGQSFARRFGVDKYALRIGAVIAPHEYQKVFSNYIQEPNKWDVHGWSYTDARDLGKMCHLCILKDGLGFEVFNATNDSITNQLPTNKFLRGLFPHIPLTREMGEREAPITNRKLKSLLGFVEEHQWEKYYYV